MTQIAAHSLHLIATRLAKCLSVGGQIYVCKPEGTTPYATLKWEVEINDGAYLTMQEVLTTSFLASLSRTDYLAEAIAKSWLQKYDRIVGNSDA